MAQIGETDRLNIYIVREADEPPASDADFTDYSDYFLTFHVKKRKGKLAYFEGTVESIETAAEKLDIAEGNALYVLSGNVLVGKFIIEKPDYDMGSAVKITGVQSTGTSSRVGTRLRKLVNVNTNEVAFRSFTTNNILDNSTAGFYGLIKDPDSGTTILALDGTDDGGTERIALELNNMNQIEAINKASVISNQEWWIEHGTNDVTPFDEGDTLHVATREGNGTSVYTFYIDSSGSNQDAFLASNNKEIESVVNEVTIEGTDVLGNSIATTIYEATAVSTQVDGNFDSWLNQDIDAAQTSIIVKKCSYWEGLSTPFTIRIDREFIRVDSVASGGANASTLTVTRGWDGTDSEVGRGKDHKNGQDVVLMSEDDTLGGGTTITITVDDTSSFPASGDIRIGSEKFIMNSKTATTFVCNRTTLGLYTAYSHGDNITVYDAQFNPGTPDTTTTNSIRSYGRQAKTFNENSTLTKDSLDRKGEAILAASKEPIHRITINPIDVFDVLDAVSIGDTVTINDGTTIDFPQGGPYVATDARVMGMDVSFDNGTFVKLYLNQDDIRVLEFSEVNFGDEFSKQQQPKTNEPSIRKGELTSPHADLIINGNVIPDPDATFAALSFTPSLGTEDDPWKYMFIDTSIVCPDNELIIQATDATGSPDIAIVRIGAATGEPILKVTPGSVARTSLTGGVDEGMLYADGVDNNLYYYDGTSWVDLTASAVAGEWQSAGAGLIEPATLGDDIVPNGTADIGGTADRWNKLWVVDGDFSGDVILGNGNSDSVTFNADVISNIEPDLDDTYNLGSASKKWAEINLGLGGAIFEGGTNDWDITTDGSSTIRLRRTGGGDFDIGTATNLIDIQVHGNVSPGTTGARDLGTDSLRWGRGYFEEQIHIGDSSSDEIILREVGSDLVIEMQNTTGVDIRPTNDNVHELGTSGSRWADVNSVLINGAAYCESNLLPEEVFSLPDSELGDVWTWKEGKLVKCDEEYSSMVQAVSTHKGTAIVMGAEPIKVIGKVTEGDYLVSSSTPGCAMVGEVGKLIPGCVIAQALESSESPSEKLIKAMIRKF